jgi:hypothetical protein
MEANQAERTLAVARPQWAIVASILLSAGFLLMGARDAIAQVGTPALSPMIHNFDKLLVGTDKIEFIAPMPGETWTITAGVLMIEQPIPEATINLWIEDAPFEPYRDPITGEMNGCAKCLTLLRVSATRRTFVSLQRVLPLTITGPTRIGIAVSPPHGGLAEPTRLYVRLRY